jgi:aspartate aminotransferase
MRLSSRVAGLRESATLKINAIVNRLKQEGKPIYNLTAGEPDSPPPEAAKEAVINAVKKNLSRYTPTPGLPELREAIAAHTNRRQPSLTTPWSAQEVVVSNGGKQAIFNSVFSLIDAGDEVLFPAPYWLSYPEMVSAAGGKSVILPTSADQGYRLSPETLESAITPRTRLFLINSPSNPTGALYTREELRELGKVLERHPDVWILSDEIYDRIEFEKGSWCSFLEANPGLKDRTITVNGLSKSGSMTGWRIGWTVAPVELTRALIALQGHSTSGICSLSQHAAIAALSLPESDFESQRLQYLHRRNLALEVLGKSEKIEVCVPRGAFYLFVDCKRALGQNQDANGFAERLLQDAQVAVVSGVDFGAPTCIRLSFAVDEKTLVEACQRIVDYLDTLPG